MNEYLKDLARHYDDGLEMTGMLKYSDGTLVMFTVGTAGRKYNRVAFYRFISVDQDRDTLHKVWDFSC